MLGQHSAQVLQELLGKSTTELAQLKSAGVI
jgi:crotonobetainyl-CoA:carnitine CoA-transferase CaiB-like acyl-CoA transferase